MTPRRNRQKRYAAFLSYANQDEELVKALQSLFAEMDEETYYARKSLRDAGDPQWREQILQGIADSHCFVPIYTRHSLGRSWVVYESGAADCAKLFQYPARVSGVAHSEITTLPGLRDCTVYDLSDRDELIDLLINVLRRKGDANKNVIAAAVRQVAKPDNAHVKRILSLAKTRWVFIAGNIPRESHCNADEIPWSTNPQDYKNRMEHFTSRLTVALLDAGFSIASCPQVPTVGKVAAVETMRWMTENSPADRDRYQIAGLYPIDREARESGLTIDALRQWKQELMTFRKSYLPKYEWLIVVGGSAGTSEEYDVAASLPFVKKLSIPCFGGVSLDIWNRNATHRSAPCSQCTAKNGECGDAVLQEIVRRMKED